MTCNCYSVDDSPAARSDRIHVEQLELFGRVGVTENERTKPQRLTFTITAWPRRQFNDVADDISRTVNYSAVCATVREFVDAHSFKLIETMAEQLSAHLLGCFALNRIAIELRKFVVPGTQHVSVMIERFGQAKES